MVGTLSLCPPYVRTSRLIVALAQKILGEISERGSRQCGEWQGTRDVDRGQPKPCGQQAVEHAFAEPLRELCRDAMAEHLLHQAVAHRHAAGDGEMADDVTQ